MTAQNISNTKIMQFHGRYAPRLQDYFSGGLILVEAISVYWVPTQNKYLKVTTSAYIKSHYSIILYSVKIMNIYILLLQYVIKFESNRHTHTYLRESSLQNVRPACKQVPVLSLYHIWSGNTHVILRSMNVYFFHFILLSGFPFVPVPLYCAQQEIKVKLLKKANNETITAYYSLGMTRSAIYFTSKVCCEWSYHY